MDSIKINGKVYTAISMSPTKRGAQSYARVMRKTGKLARVVRRAGDTWYTVYIRNQ